MAKSIQNILLLSSFLASLTFAQPKPPALCRDSLPTLSVSTHPTPIDVQQYEILKKSHELFIMGVSDSLCSTGGANGYCCQTESILQDFIDLKLKHKGKIIPVVRVDISKKQSQAVLSKEDISFDSVPRIVIFRDGRLFSYDQPFDRVDLLVHHINRILNPLVVLKTEEEVERFMSLGSENEPEFWEGDYNTTFMRQIPKGALPEIGNHWGQQRLKTRAICFIYDKQEYKEELNTFKKDARVLSTRDNLRLGLVDNQRLVRKMKASKYGTRLFAPVSMSSIVLRRYDGVLKVHDITGDDHVSPHQWINKNSLKEVEELDNESYRIQELVRQPMFIAFVDFQDPWYSKESYRLVELLKEVAPKYSHLVSFYHVNNTLMWQRKRVLGVTWDELPAMAFNFLGDSSRALPYPRGREVSKKAMFDFFDDLFTGRKVGTEEDQYQPPKDFSKTKNDTEIEPVLLNNTILANRGNFGELVYQEGYDALVLLYTTEIINAGQRTVALQVNLVADAFKKLQEAFPQQQIGTSVRIVAYDVNVNAFPEGIDFTLDLPQILFLPAYDKKPPFRRFLGQAAIAGPLLQFIEKNADVKFKYPVDISRIGFPRENTTTTEQPPAAEVTQEEQQVINNEDL